MKRFRKMLSILLVLAVLLTGMPISTPAMAAEDNYPAAGETGSETEDSGPAGSEENTSVELKLGYISPLYEDLITEDMLTRPRPITQEQSFRNAASESVTRYTSQESAGTALRRAFLDHQESFRMEIVSDAEPEDEWISVIEIALKHTRNPKEGDYLWQQMNVYQYFEKNEDVVYLEYWPLYYLTEDELADVDQAVETIISSLNLDGRTEYEKAKACYSYLTENVRYDYDSLENSTPDEYILPYSAYGALVLNTCVCQGYALALYRLLLECGVDNRLIIGQNHAWNLIKIGKYWYNADSTWDEGCNEANYRFFLVTDEAVQKYDYGTGSHIRREDYSTDEFYAEHPMGTDYTLAVTIGTPFQDVSPSAWYYLPVFWAYKYKITAGTTATVFSPDKTCTRAEFVTFLYKFVGALMIVSFIY